LILTDRETAQLLIYFVGGCSRCGRCSGKGTVRSRKLWGIFQLCL